MLCKSGTTSAVGRIVKVGGMTRWFTVPFQISNEQLLYQQHKSPSHGNDWGFAMLCQFVLEEPTES